MINIDILKSYIEAEKGGKLFMVNTIVLFLLTCLTSSSTYAGTLPVWTESAVISYGQTVKNKSNTLQPDSSIRNPLESVTSNVYRPGIDTQIDINRITKPVRWGNKSKAEIALTFDDGFDKAAIESTLDELKKANLNCTFFIVGDALQDYPDLWRRAAAEGHQICNHTNTHKFLENASDQEIKEEIENWEITVKKILGEDYFKKMKNEFPYFRFPGGLGDSNERNLKIVSGLGYIPVAWSAETYYDVLRHHNLKTEPSGPVIEQVVNHVIGVAQNGSIILLHFNTFDTTGLDRIIDGITGKSLKILPLSEVLKDGQ